jgi:hypothetical protein
LFVPLALLGLIYGKKKHKNKLDYVVIVVFISLGVGLGLTACGNPPAGGFTATGTAIQVPGVIVATGTATHENGATVDGTIVIPTSTPNVVATPCLTITPSPTGTPTPEVKPDQMDDGEWGPKSKKLYNLYLRLHREKEDGSGNKTLWWRIYGADGNFTLVDFTAMILIREVSTAPGLDGINMNDFVEALGRRAYTWCKVFSGYNCDSTTNKGMIYHIVEWSEIADDIADKCGTIAETCNLSNYFKSEYGSDTEGWALKIANGMHAPEGIWMVFDKNALWDAGNVHPQVLKPYKVEDMHTDLRHDAHYESPGGKFFLVTFCESVFLRDEMSLYNNWGCNLLPN